VRSTNEVFPLDRAVEATSAWSGQGPVSRGAHHGKLDPSLSDLLYRWDQQPNQNGDDGDNDQGFNSGETVYGTLGLIRDIFHVFLQSFRLFLLQFRNQLSNPFLDRSKC